MEGAKEVRVFTDHAPNTYLPSQHTLSRRQARWSGFLQRFATLTWHYKPGKVNVADPVSRAPHLPVNGSALELAAESWHSWVNRVSHQDLAPGGKKDLDRKRDLHGAASLAVDSADLLAAVNAHDDSRCFEPASAVNVAEGEPYGAVLRNATAVMAASGPQRATPELLEPGLLDRIKKAYSSDEYFDSLESEPGHMLKDGLWRGGPMEAVKVPNDSNLREAIVLEAHRQGHFGMTATHERVRSCFWWNHGDLTMRQVVDAVVRSL